jgi:hypothetical protein
MSSYTRRTFSTTLLEKYSSEYIEHIVLREAVKLINLRCLDLGFIPYNQMETGKVKLWGMPRFLNSSFPSSHYQQSIKSISLESTLDELKLTPLRELLLKNCI